MRTAWLDVGGYCSLITENLPYMYHSTCLDDSKPCMILEVLIKLFQNHIGFATIGASGKEW